MKKGDGRTFSLDNSPLSNCVTHICALFGQMGTTPKIKIGDEKYKVQPILIHDDAIPKRELDIFKEMGVELRDLYKQSVKLPDAWIESIKASSHLVRIVTSPKN